MTDEPKDYDKTYTVRLSEREMAAIGACMTAYFNRMTAAKVSIPVAYAELVMSALQKMKAASEGKAVLVIAQ